MLQMFCGIVLVAMIVAAIVADAKLPEAAHLPMQWGLNGQPTWYAPRIIALAIIPSLSFVVILVLLAMAASAPRTIVLTVIFLFSVDLFHLWLTYRYLSHG